MPKKPSTPRQFLIELEELRARLAQSEEALRAIRGGEADALIVTGVAGKQLFTVQGADRFYRVLIEDMSEGALTLTAEGVILYANRRLAEMLKTPLEKVIGSAINTWIVPDSQGMLQTLLRRDDTETHRRGEVTLLAGDGTSVPGYLSVNVLQMEEMPGLLCMVATDLTKQKRTEAIVASEKLAQELMKKLQEKHDELSRRNIELQGFYHTISHELKTPLTSAREFLSIMLDGIAGPLTDDQKLYLQLARESCDQLAFCINDLTDATRLETGKLKIHAIDMPVERFVAGVVSAMTPAMKAKGVELRYKIDPVVSTASVEERRIYQVCMNLLSNALKYTPAGGVVTMQVRDDPQEPEMIRFSVGDTGYGIAPDHLDRIFDKLYQVRMTDTSIEGGLGLGLYIASRIVRLHGGRMWAESTVGSGSIFYFTLRKRLYSPCYHILYVDDDAEEQETMRAILEQAGFGVSVAGDGVTALEIVRDQAADLAIVDLCLLGMPSPVLMRELRKKCDDLPLIVYTGYPENQLMIQAMDCSPLTMLTKPCPREKLIATVRAMLAPRAPSTVGRPDRDPSGAF